MFTLSSCTGVLNACTVSCMQAALRAALEGLQMSGGKELDAPAGRLAIPLMRHQRLALAWMLHRERSAANPRGGILADDQGLGKTISTIALIVTNQRGDDVADEGFGHQASDTEDEDADAVANADAAQDANADAAENTVAAAAGNTAQAPDVADGEHVHHMDVASTLTPAVASLSDASCSSVPSAAAANLAEAPNSHDHDHKLAQPALHSNSVVRSDDTQNGVSKLKPGAPGPASPDQHHTQEEPGNVRGLPEGGTLIICPTAVLNQWSRELNAKVAPPAGKCPFQSGTCMVVCCPVRPLNCLSLHTPASNKVRQGDSHQQQ